MGRMIIIIMIGMAIIFTTVSLNVQGNLGNRGPRLMEEQLYNTQAQKLATYALDVALRDFHDSVDNETFDVENATSYYYNGGSAVSILNGAGTINSVNAIKTIDTADSTVWEFTANAQWYGEGNTNNYQTHSSKAEIVVYPPQEGASNLHPDLLRLFDLNEGSGTTTTDLTGEGVADILGGRWDWVEGKYGTGIDMNVDRIHDTSSATENIGQQFTVTAWIKPDAGGLLSADWGHVIGESNNWLLRARALSVFWGLASNLYMNFSVNHPSGRADVGTNHTYWLSSILQDWFFVVGSYDGVAGRISVSFTDRNGDTYSNSANAPVWTEAWNTQLGEDIYMGGAEEPDFGSGFFRWLLEWLVIRLQSFNGVLDEVALYDRLLDADELRDQMGNILPYEGEAGEPTPRVFKLSSWNE